MNNKISTQAITTLKIRRLLNQKSNKHEKKNRNFDGISIFIDEQIFTIHLQNSYLWIYCSKNFEIIQLSA